MGFKWTNGLVFGINVDDCTVVDEEEEEYEEGSVIQVFIGVFMFYIIIRG